MAYFICYSYAAAPPPLPNLFLVERLKSILHINQNLSIFNFQKLCKTVFKFLEYDNTKNKNFEHK